MGGNIQTSKFSYLPRLFGMFLMVMSTFLPFTNANILILILLGFVISIHEFVFWLTTTVTVFLTRIPNEKSGTMVGMLGTITCIGLFIGSDFQDTY